MKINFTLLTTIIMMFCCSSILEAKVFSDTTGFFPIRYDLNTPTDWVKNIIPPTDCDFFRIAAVYDMNKDGYDDIIIFGGKKYKSWKTFNPVIYIIYGNKNIPVRLLMDSPSIPTATINWEDTDHFLHNMSILKIGDVNGDKIPDFIIPGYQNDQSNLPDYRLYAILGTTNWQGKNTISMESSQGINVHASEGNFYNRGYMAYEEDDSFLIADMDKDGYDDIIFSYPGKQGLNSVPSGKIYIVFGINTMPPEINAETSKHRISKIVGDTLYQRGQILFANPNNPVITYGLINFTVGDIDRDYKPDLITDGGFNRSFYLIPSSYRDNSIFKSLTYIIYGAVLQRPELSGSGLSLKERITGLVTLTRDWETKLPSTVQDYRPYDDSPHKLSTGDVNGDGYDDLIIRDYMSGGYYEGKAKVYILFGSRNFLFSGSIAGYRFGITKIESLNKGDHLGYKFAMGDINGDGYKDLLIGTDGDKFYIIYGKNTLPASIQIDSNFTQGSTFIGGNIVSSGDINNDGYEDIVGSNKNGVFIIMGRGKTYRERETIVQSLSLNDKSKYSFIFADSSKFQFRFTQGELYYIPELHLTNYGNHLPDSLQSIPTTQKVVSFIQAELTNMSTLYAYRVQCSIDYTDSSLTTSNIKEQDLIVSTWDEQNSKWEKLQTSIDTTLNRATFEVEHLSLFALTDKNDSIMTDVTETTAQIPLTFELSQNYPNPFNPQTIIRFQVARLEDLKIIVYNILGQEVKTIISGRLSAGTHEVRWDGTDKFGNKVASGIYIYRMETKSGYVRTRKMVYLK